MQQHAFQRLLTEFPPERERFDLLIERMRERKDIDAASDGSWLDDGRASAGWLLWMMSDEIDDEGQLTRQPKILIGSTMCVDGRLYANTAFRAEALGCLIIPIIICLAKEFIQQTQRLQVRHTCDNRGLVDQLSWLYKQERYHTIPDTEDNDFMIPTDHWAKKNDSRLICQQGHTERREKYPTKWTNDVWANGAVERLAGRAWEEAFSQVQNQANAQRFRLAGVIQVITSEGSIAGQIPKRLPELLTMEHGLPAL